MLRQPTEPLPFCRCLSFPSPPLTPAPSSPLRSPAARASRPSRSPPSPDNVPSAMNALLLLLLLPAQKAAWVTPSLPDGKKHVTITGAGLLEAPASLQKGV